MVYICPIPHIIFAHILDAGERHFKSTFVLVQYDAKIYVVHHGESSVLLSM